MFTEVLNEDVLSTKYWKVSLAEKPGSAVVEEFVVEVSILVEDAQWMLSQKQCSLRPGPALLSLFYTDIASCHGKDCIFISGEATRDGGIVTPDKLALF